MVAVAIGRDHQPPVTGNVEGDQGVPGVKELRRQITVPATLCSTTAE
jgi:hypothetical protein